jgi:phage baseplate assembly protein W|tara:strand:- start:3399 stop:3782 length:384 start_codon:yes stop_codon:yes gene_type:complete
MNNIIGFTNSQTSCTSVILTDLELAKQDLRNHFSITKGEKWTLPNFGSNIPNYIFEPLDGTIVELIQQDVVDVVSYDPRFQVTTHDVKVSEDTLAVTVNIELTYVPLAQITTLELLFDRDTTQLENN